jgi:hypothetical protein
VGVHIDNWGAEYGSSYNIPEDSAEGDGQLVEDGDQTIAHPCVPSHPEDVKVAFVDGIRRIDGSLSWEEPDGSTVRGIAGSYGVGAVICDGVARPAYGAPLIRRLLVWNGDDPHNLPDAGAGFSWEPRCTASTEPDAPLHRLQELMREAEGGLADQLCIEGWTVIVDGPLNFVRSRDCAVVGYAKTHHKMHLPLEFHRRIPRLRAGERSSLFRTRSEAYSCYLRLAEPNAMNGSWHGIVRLEVPDSQGLAAAAQAVDRAGGLLPRYAGIVWRDPRAPQNLQPVGALESRLRHLLGDPHLATIAVRQAVVASA